jgi:hypothetical protein
VAYLVTSMLLVYCLDCLVSPSASSVRCWVLIGFLGQCNSLDLKSDSKKFQFQFQFQRKLMQFDISEVLTIFTFIGSMICIILPFGLFFMKYARANTFSYLKLTYF